MNFIIKDVSVVNENTILSTDVLIKNGRIEKLAQQIDVPYRVEEIQAGGLHLFPGVIDDQVHFREPGLTEKATIYTEAKAAVAGGVTSFMEMPNTKPPACTEQLLEEKYDIARQHALANYSFFMGTSNTNAEEVLKMNKKKSSVCGVKIFMGSSTGNLLVNDPRALEKVFGQSELLIATHCEDEDRIHENYDRLKREKKELTAADHQLIRDVEACYLSSSKAVGLARKHGSRLHILHISTQKELSLFQNDIPRAQKKITSEVCVHHLHFTADDYPAKGNFIKCNPAIKSGENRLALWEALKDGRLDVIATDHAPHTLAEKEKPYETAPAGLPLVQHPLLLMLHYARQGQISLELIADKMSHAVADCFQIHDRGYIREGYWADLVLVNLQKPFTVQKENIFYKCGWSPFENFTFPATITHTFVNGHLAYANGQFDESQQGMRLAFLRD